GERLRNGFGGPHGRGSSPAPTAHRSRTRYRICRNSHEEEQGPPGDRSRHGHSRSASTYAAHGSEPSSSGSFADSMTASRRLARGWGRWPFFPVPTRGLTAMSPTIYRQSHTPPIG